MKNNYLQATYSKNGPAMTLKINGTVNTKPVKMEIDLVPSFLFDRAEWPKGGYRENPVLTKVRIIFMYKMSMSPLINNDSKIHGVPKLLY